MKKTILMTAAAATAFAGSATAANIATGATVLSGVHTVIDGTLGTAYARGDQAAHETENDGLTGDTTDPTTQRDTWGATQNGGVPGGSDGGIDYIGYSGLVIPVGEAITQVVINQSVFFDGGWFGLSGLDSTILASAPTLQVSSDDGTTWTNVATTNDYTTQAATVTPGPSPNPQFFTATFDFAGQTGVNAIRLIGESAGSGDSATGFIGVAELQVNTTPIPEPSSSALLGLAGLTLILRRRK